MNPIQMLLPFMVDNSEYNDKTEVYVWSNGKWVRKYDYDEVEYTFFGDNFSIMFLPMELGDEDIEHMVKSFNEGESL